MTIVGMMVSDCSEKHAALTSFSARMTGIVGRPRNSSEFLPRSPPSRWRSFVGRRDRVSFLGRRSTPSWTATDKRAAPGGPDDVWGPASLPCRLCVCVCVCGRRVMVFFVDPLNQTLRWLTGKCIDGDRSRVQSPAAPTAAGARRACQRVENILRPITRCRHLSKPLVRAN